MDKILSRIETAVASLHYVGKVWASPQDEDTFVSLSELSPNEFVNGLAICDVTMPVQFTVSQVRQAAACPRLLHLDAEHTRSNKLKTPRVTQIWQTSDRSDVGALGTLFHQAVENFNDTAVRSKPLNRLLSRRPTKSELSSTLQVLSSTAWQKERNGKLHRSSSNNFMAALAIYANELSEVLFAGLQGVASTDELVDQMFGDLRKEVDATFEVGLGKRPIRVLGRLDYIFHDWRSDTRRILDYKLTPSKCVDADLCQVCMYALLHHEKYGTKCDVALLYLHPERKMVQLSWKEVEARRNVIYDLLASMVEWKQFQSKPPQGLRPPGNSAYCTSCRYEKTCTSKLGAVGIGDRLTQWKDADRDGSTDHPKVQQNADVECNKSELSTPTDNSIGVDSCNQTTDSLKINGDAKKQINQLVKSSNALFLGLSETGRVIELPLPNITKHVAVVGASGSGKTWMAKVIAEESIRQGVPIIAIDPQGDLVQFLRQTENLTGEYREAHKKFCSRVETRIFTPGTSHGRRMHVDPLRLPSVADLSQIGDEARKKEERQSMIAATVTNLINLARVGADKDLQRTYMMQIVDLLLAASTFASSKVGLSDLAAAVMARFDRHG